jgi:hypothetical protein
MFLGCDSPTDSVTRQEDLHIFSKVALKTGIPAQYLRIFAVKIYSRIISVASNSF